MSRQKKAGATKAKTKAKPRANPSRSRAKSPSPPAPPASPPPEESCPHLASPRLNLEAAAKHFDISTQAYRQWLAKGAPYLHKPTTPKDSWRICPECVAAWRSGRDAEKEKSTTTQTDYWTEKTRREKAEASLAEMKLAQQRGEMVEASAVARILVGLFGGMRDKLSALPSKLAPRLANCSAIEAQQVIGAEIHDILNDLSRPDVEALLEAAFAPDPASDGHVPAAAAHDSQPVG